MSDAVSILNGAEFQGAVTVRDAGLVGMITLRGDLADETLAKAVKSVTGQPMPKARGLSHGAKGSVLWMSPDELLLMVAYDRADAMVAKLDKALGAQHMLAVNVSDARAMFTLTGARCREVIAKGAPVDMSGAALGVAEVRRSRLGQVAAAFWLTDETTLNVVCFRSVGGHVYRWLCVAAEPDTLPGFL